MADPPLPRPPSPTPAVSKGASDLLDFSEDFQLAPAPSSDSTREATDLLSLETANNSVASNSGEVSGATSSSDGVRLPDMPQTPATEVFDMGRGSPQMEDCTPRGDIDMVIGDEEIFAAEDWYTQDDFQANKSLEESPESSASRTQVPSWASKIGKKAGKLGTAAKTAIITEAKLLSADAKDLAMGVREGASITIQDTKSLSKQLQRDAKQLSKQSAAGWRGLWTRGSSKASLGDSELAEPTPAVASSNVGATSSTSALTAEDSTAMEVARQSSMNKDDTGTKGAKGVAVVGALKETWSATAEASSQMWRDLKEAKDEAMIDLRSSMQDLRQGVQKLRPTAGQSEGLAREGCKENGEHDLDVGEAETVKPSAPATEALDMLLSGALDADLDDSIARRGSDSRAPSDRRTDESGPHLQSKMEEMARATSNMSAKIWRKTELSIKQALPSMQRVPSGGKEFEQEARCDEERQSQTQPLDASSREDSSVLAPAESNTPRSTPSTPRSSSEVRKATGTDAARRARKLGGRIAKKSREISGNMLKQAGAVASMRPKSGNFAGFSTGDNAKGEEEEGIFEIGSDEEEELFAGDGNSVTGSDFGSKEDSLSLNSPRSNPSSRVDQERKAGQEDMLAEPEVTSSSLEAGVVPNASGTSPPNMTGTEDRTESMAAPNAHSTAHAAHGETFDERVLVPPTGDASKVAETPPDVSTPIATSSSTMLAVDIETRALDTLEPVTAASPPIDNLLQFGDLTANKSSSALPPATNKADAETKTPDAPSLFSTREPEKDADDDWFDDMLADTNALDPIAVSSTPVTASVPDVVDTSEGSAKIDFLAAAEKELEDLFGLDD